MGLMFMTDKIYQKHSNVQKSIQLEANKMPGVKLWSNPIGLGWVANPDPRKTKKYTKNGKRYVLLENPYPVKFGLCKGSLDLIGFKVECVNDFEIPRFICIDAKTDAHPNYSPEQENYHDMVIKSGGIAGKLKKASGVADLLSMPLLKG